MKSKILQKIFRKESDSHTILLEGHLYNDEILGPAARFFKIARIRIQCLIFIEWMSPNDMKSFFIPAGNHKKTLYYE
jgi:hypothetical protein